MMSYPPSNTRSSYKITRNKANKRWRGSQVRVRRQKLPRSNCFTCTVVDLQALDVLQTGVQAAPSVSGNLKTENAETIYIQRTMHLDPLKKPLVSTPTVFFLSIPAPYLRPRHTCARAIPAPARSITSRVKRQNFPAGRMQTPFQLFYTYSSRPASAWRSADGRASCAVRVWKSEDGKHWNDLYSAYNASRSSFKKNPLVSTPTVFFLSIPAPAPYLRLRVLSQAESNVKTSPRDKCRHHSNWFTRTVVDLQALGVLQMGVQAAPSVSGNLKTENAETIYIQRTMHLDPLKKPLVSTPTVFFLSIPAPYLRPRHTCACAIPAPAPYLRLRHTCARAIPAPAPYLRLRVLSQAESNVKTSLRDECRHHSNCFTLTVVDLEALGVLQTGVQAAPSVSGNLKTENAETIYIQRTMHLDPLKKPLVSTPTVFFLSIPAPYLRPRHTCACAIPAPAPYLRLCHTCACAFYHKPSQTSKLPRGTNADTIPTVLHLQ